MDFEKNVPYENIERSVENSQTNLPNGQTGDNCDNLSYIGSTEDRPELKLIAGARCAETALEREIVAAQINQQQVKYALPDDLGKLKANAMSPDLQDPDRAWNTFAALLKKYVVKALKDEDLGFASFLASDEQYYGQKNSREIRLTVDKAVQMKIDDAYKNNQLEQVEQYVDLLTVPFNRDLQRKQFENRIYTELEGKLYVQDFKRAKDLMSKIKHPEQLIKAYKAWDKGVLGYLRKAHRYGVTHPERFDEIKSKIRHYEHILKTADGRKAAMEMYDYYKKPVIRQSDNSLNNAAQSNYFYPA